MKVLHTLLIVLGLFGAVSAPAQYLYQKGCPTLGEVIDLQGLPDGSAIVLSEATHNNNVVPTLSKINPNGTTQWVEYLIPSKAMLAGSCVLTPTSEIVCALYPEIQTNTNVLLVRCSPNGAIIRTKSIGFPNPLYKQHLLARSDGSFILYGMTTQNGSSSVSVIALDSLFAPQWSKSYRLYTSNEPILIGRGDGSICLIRNMGSKLGIVGISAQGDVDTQFVYSSKRGPLVVSQAERLFDGSIIAGGTIFSGFDFAQRSAFFRFSPELELQQILELDNLTPETAASIAQTPDGEIILASCNLKEPKARIFKLDRNGMVLSVSEFTCPGDNPLLFSTAFVRATTAKQTLFALQTSEYSHGNDWYNDVYLMQTDSSLQGCLLKNNLISVQAIADSIDKPLPIIVFDNKVTITDLTVGITKEPQSESGTDLCNLLNVSGPPLADASVKVAIVENPIRQGTPVRLQIPVIATGNYRLVLHDLSGKVILQLDQPLHDGEELQLPTAMGLAAGVYHIELADLATSALLWKGKVIIQ